VLVPASLTTPGGEGPQALTCASSQLSTAPSTSSVVVRVTNNANNPDKDDVALTSNVVRFTYYDSFEGTEKDLQPLDKYDDDAV